MSLFIEYYCLQNCCRYILFRSLFDSNKDLNNRLDTATDDENVIFKPLTHGGDDESSPWLRRKRQISPWREIPTSKLRRLQDRDTDFQRKKVLPFYSIELIFVNISSMDKRNLRSTELYEGFLS